jgi:hypothetical protein
MRRFLVSFVCMAAVAVSGCSDDSNELRNGNGDLGGGGSPGTAGTSGSSGTVGSGGAAGTLGGANDDCKAIGELCEDIFDCCGYEQGLALCSGVGFDPTICQPSCSDDSECLPGCCLDWGEGRFCSEITSCHNTTGSDACDECLETCSGLSSCCTGLGCICEDACRVTGCNPPARLCCGPFGDCICTANCPY